MFTANKTLSTDLSTSIPQRRSIFVIFVHFGSSEATNRAVRSLLKGTVRPDGVIVVDNDGAFASAVPVTVVRPGSNAGYAGGLREGISEALRLGAKEYDLCVLVNNDTVFEEDSLQGVLRWWDLHGSPMVLAGSAGGYVSLSSGRAIVSPKRRNTGKWDLPYVHGSSMVGEFSLFLKHKLPVSFFMYWEDVAFSMEIMKQGGLLAVISGFRVGHDDSEGPVSLSKLFYLVRNGAYVLQTYTSIPWRAYWYGRNILRMMYHFQLGGLRHTTIARALRDALIGRLGRADL